jgi:hypothetical protein
MMDSSCLFGAFYTWWLIYVLSYDNICKVETYWRCKVIIIILHVDIVRLGGYNEIIHAVSFRNISVLEHRSYCSRKYRRTCTGTSTFKPLLVTWCTNKCNIQQFTLWPCCIYMFCIYLRTNCDLCHLHHKLIGFYNRDKKCLQRCTDWGFKYISLCFVFKGLNYMYMYVFVCASIKFYWFTNLVKIYAINRSLHIHTFNFPPSTIHVARVK